MDQPNKEQAMYAQMAIAQSILEHVKDLIPGTIFEDRTIITLFDTLMQGMGVTQMIMQKSFEESQKPKSVCY